MSLSWEYLVKLDNLCNASPLASLVFCCKKECPFRNEALRLLEISKEEYIRVKEELSIEAKGTCYGNLAYCCSLNAPCDARDNALKELGMTPSDYLKYKYKILKKLIPERKMSLATKERVTYLLAFEMVNLHDVDVGYRGIAVGNPELVSTVSILNYNVIKPQIDSVVKETLKKEKILSVRVSKRVYDSLADIASENGCSVSDVVRDAVMMYLSMSKREENYINDNFKEK